MLDGHVRNKSTLGHVEFTRTAAIMQPKRKRQRLAAEKRERRKSRITYKKDVVSFLPKEGEMKRLYSFSPPHLRGVKPCSQTSRTWPDSRPIEPVFGQTARDKRLRSCRHTQEGEFEPYCSLWVFCPSWLTSWCPVKQHYPSTPNI